MKIAFYAQSCIPIHARSLEERPLGGTETGLIHVARILRQRGHEVTVFTSLRNPPQFQDEPLYLHGENAARLNPFDVFISVKDWKSAFYGGSAARFFYWTGDGPEQYATWGLGDRRVERRFQAVLCASQWQARSLAESAGASLDRFAVIGNGVDLSLFAGEEQRIRHRLIYTSAPYRGLELLGPVFQKLRELFPELELHIFSGMSLYDTDRPFEGPLEAEGRRILGHMAKLPGVTIRGNVTQRELAREYMRAGIFAYPNTVNETFCITAIEAQAAGTPVVSSARAGLIESVGEAGILVNPTQELGPYLTEFASAVSALLKDEALWRRLSGIGTARVHSRFHWGAVVDRIENLLARELRL